MSFASLHSKILMYLSFLILLGMLCFNFVVIVFWQNHMVKQAVQHAVGYVSLLAATYEEQGSFQWQWELHEGLHEIPELEEVKGLFLYQMHAPFSYDGVEKERITALLAESAAQQQGFVKYLGSQATLMGPRFEWALVAQSLHGPSGKAALGVLIDLRQIEKDVLKNEPILLLYCLVNTFFLVIIGFLRLRRTVMQPLQKLVSLANEYRYNIDSLLGVKDAKNEFGYVSQSLHAMLSRIERDKAVLDRNIVELETANREILANQKKLVETEKFAATGRLAAGLAHEIGNPLGIVAGYLDLLCYEDLSTQEYEEYIQRSKDELQRVAALIRQLLDFSRKKEKSDGVADAWRVVEHVVALMKSHHRHICFSVVCADGEYPVACDSDVLHQILLNCLLNSVDAIDEKKRKAGGLTDAAITVTINTEVETQGGRAGETADEREDRRTNCRIEIRDTGIGLGAEEKKSVFDPFFTTKDVGKGTGLGLSVSRMLVENCGGTISLTGCQEGGALLEIVLPQQ